MHGVGLARNIVGTVGNFISGVLFLSPGPTVKRIWTKKSTEEFHPYPYLASAMNCMLWIFYGLPFVHPDSLLVVTINSIGLFVEALYLALFFYYTTKKHRYTIVGVLAGEIVLLCIVAAVTCLCFHTHDKRSTFVGVICVVFGIIMYASPLSVIKTVIKSKNPKPMPFWLCVAGFANGVVWTIYAFLKIFDPYILAANGIGAILGVIQLSVYGYCSYWNKRNGSEQRKQVKETNGSDQTEEVKEIVMIIKD